MSTPRRSRRDRAACSSVGALLMACAACVQPAVAEPAVRYVQGTQGLVVMRADAGASAPVPAHRAVDSVMVDGKMTQVLRESSVAPNAKLAAQVPAVTSESVLPNGSRMRTLPHPAVQTAPAATPKLTIAEPAGEVLPRPLVLYRMAAPVAPNH